MTKSDSILLLLVLLGWGLPTKSASGNEPTGASAECYSRFDRRRYIRDSRDMALLHSPFRISRKDIISGNKFYRTTVNACPSVIEWSFDEERTLMM